MVENNSKICQNIVYDLSNWTAWVPSQKARPLEPPPLKWHDTWQGLWTAAN